MIYSATSTYSYMPMTKLKSCYKSFQAAKQKTNHSSSTITYDIPSWLAYSKLTSCTTMKKGILNNILVRFLAATFGMHINNLPTTSFKRFMGLITVR